MIFMIKMLFFFTNRKISTKKINYLKLITNFISILINNFI